MATQPCPQCNFSNPAGFRFCGRCGSPIEAVPDGASNGDKAALRIERRQVTVMFCDLVGSTALSQRLDPEDLWWVLRGYQQACDPIIERFGGYISRFQGDGILAYFGYPVAHEDNAERAVHAGLEIVRTIGTLEWQERLDEPLKLAVRVGIATGLVVAGDQIGKGASEEEVVFGETPNLAARLQNLAAPDTVIIGARTQRLVAQSFELALLAQQALKGFGKPVDAWQVLHARRRRARFRRRRSDTRVPLINRASELTFLRERWDYCKTGKSRTVVISGEAGIGKSRLLQALHEQIAQNEHYHLLYQCSANHTSSALHPVISHLEYEAQVERIDAPAVREQKLVKTLQFTGAPPETLLGPLSSLLQLPNDSAMKFERLEAHERKQTTFNALVDQMRALALRHPVLVVAEDIHWIDPSSLELLQRGCEQLRELPILFVITQRTDSPVALDGFRHAEYLYLSRLEASHCYSLVQAIAGKHDLSVQMIERIVDKADGVALFAEELTLTLREQPFAHPSAQALDSERLEQAIPETLYESLMARLDRLHPGKRVAQIGAIIGREFAHDILEQVIDLPSAQLQDGLQQLIDAGLLMNENEPLPRASYTFRHALLRDTAYTSLLREERRILHRDIADILAHSGSVTPMEVLALHYSEAADYERAVHSWLEAGKKASERAAMREAVEHFQSGLTLIPRLSVGLARERLKLELLNSLGPALIATHGPGSRETESVYREAVVTAEALPVSQEHFTALWGQWRIDRSMAGKAAIAERLEKMAVELGDDRLRLQAHHCIWPTLFHRGEHEQFRQHIEQGIKLYAKGDYRDDANHFGGHDALSCAHGNLAQSLWLTGHPDQALAAIEKARQWSTQLRHTGSLLHTMDCTLLLHRYRNDWRAAAGQAEELAALARQHQFREYEVKAQVFIGWADVYQGHVEKGLSVIRASIDSQDPIGTNEDPPVWLEMLAQCFCDIDKPEQGLEVIEEAFMHTTRTGLQFWLPELYRQKGELLQSHSQPQLLAARTCFLEALRLSKAQGALLLELRATMSLLSNARKLDQSVGIHMTQLKSCRERFTEGFDTADVLQADEIVRKEPA